MTSTIVLFLNTKVFQHKNSKWKFETCLVGDLENNP